MCVKKVYKMEVFDPSGQSNRTVNRIDKSRYPGVRQEGSHVALCLRTYSVSISRESSKKKQGSEYMHHYMV